MPVQKEPNPMMRMPSQLEGGLVRRFFTGEGNFDGWSYMFGVKTFMARLLGASKRE